MLNSTCWNGLNTHQTNVGSKIMSILFKYCIDGGSILKGVGDENQPRRF